MKPKITGKKKKGSAAGASSGKGHAPGAGEKRRRETASAADDDDMFMPVPSFENDGKELDLGGAGPAWKTYDWQGEKSAREKKREGGAGAGNARADADAKRAEKRSTKEPVVNRKKPPRPEKKVKVDMRFGSEADKKKLADERFNERREAKRQKYAALTAAAAEHDGAGDDEPGVSGKVLGRRRRAAEKRARAAEKRRADRLDKGLPVDRPVKQLPAKLAVGTAAGVSALAKRGGDDAGDDENAAGKNKNAKRKERREKARLARDAEESKAQVTFWCVSTRRGGGEREAELTGREGPRRRGIGQGARATREARSRGGVGTPRGGAPRGGGGGLGVGLGSGRCLFRVCLRRRGGRRGRGLGRGVQQRRGRRGRRDRLGRRRRVGRRVGRLGRRRRRLGGGGGRLGLGGRDGLGG
jgi:ribosomal RNA-processing protein 8